MPQRTLYPMLLNHMLSHSPSSISGTYKARQSGPAKTEDLYLIARSTAPSSLRLLVDFGQFSMKPSRIDRRPMLVYLDQKEGDINPQGSLPFVPLMWPHYVPLFHMNLFPCLLFPQTLLLIITFISPTSDPRYLIIHSNLFPFLSYL